MVYTFLYFTGSCYAFAPVTGYLQCDSRHQHQYRISRQNETRPFDLVRFKNMVFMDFCMAFDLSLLTLTTV